MTHSHLDAPSSEELFHLTDNGSGGWLQTAKRRLKFRVRYWLCQAQLGRIREFFHAHGLEELTHTELPVMLRPMRPYLWGGLTPQARTDAMLAHFEWLMARHSAQSVIDFYKRGSHISRKVTLRGLSQSKLSRGEVWGEKVSLSSI
jgi:uncharacterized protein VirK/YbjX